MNLSERIGAAWRALKGQRSDPYAAAYGSGSGGGFAGGSINRLTASLASWSNSVNADLDGALPILRARARSLAANNEHGRRFLSMVAANVVGRQNPKLQVRAMRDQRDPNKPTTLDKSANDAIEIHWERWGRTADISGHHKTFYSLLRTAVKGVARDGEALIRIVRDRRLPYGLGVQLLEADRLDDTLNARLDNGNAIRQGVEVDGTLRAVAYYVKTSHPGDDSFVAGRPGTERILAADMIHLFMPERAEQVRGITWMHAVILRGSIIHRFEEAAVVAAEIGASKVAALERAEEAPDMMSSMADAQVGVALQMNIQAGEMFELPPGYKLNGWNPEYPHANFESFLKACLRGLAAGLDVAAHNLTGDMTDVNYSSARIAELAEREMWMILQDWLISSLVMPIYEEWLALSLLSGKITFDISGKALPADRYEKFRNASRFQGRRWAWVDPLKEAEAQEKLIANKLASRTRIAAEQGDEFDDIIDELAAEKALIEAAGLGAPAPVVAPPSGAEKAVELVAAQMALRAAEPPAVPSAPTFVVHNAPPAVTVNTGETRNEINVPPQAAPEVHVDVAAPVVHVAAPDVRLEATMPAQAAPVVEVNVELPDEFRIAAMPTRETSTRIERNGAGEIVQSTQVEKDA